MSRSTGPFAQMLHEMLIGNALNGGSGFLLLKRALSCFVDKLVLQNFKSRMDLGFRGLGKIADMRACFCSQGSMKCHCVTKSHRKAIWNVENLQYRHA